MSGSLPTVVTPAGLQPQSPAALNAQLIANATALAPGLTANLPGSLIEDVSSTDTGALIVVDQARVETVNSLTPYGANDWLLIQLGNVYGVPQGQAANTSVFVVFNGTAGFVLAKGFTVSDGTHQYVLKDGGVLNQFSTSLPLLAVAVQSGSWPVPPLTVTNLITSVPSTITLAVNNPQAGTPGAVAQDEASYRAQVLQAGLAASQGMGRYLKTLLGNIPGVQNRLVSVLQQSGGGWEVICGGGGDPYFVAYAIFQALFDISTLTGSVLGVAAITNANPGVVTTTLNHGYTSGQVINIAGVVGMTGVNNTPLTITVISETTFSIGINTTSSGAYVSGGVVTPNFRNTLVSINDYPDIYTIPYVLPPQQTVTMTVTWNTSSINFVSTAAVAQLGAPALAAYVNSITVGQPMNLFILQDTFQAAIASLLPTPLLTRMVFSVQINGNGVSPDAGTGVIAGDPESYFFAEASGITINQG